MFETQYAKHSVSNRLQNIPALQRGCPQPADFISSSELAQGGRGSGELESQESTSHSHSARWTLWVFALSRGKEIPTFCPFHRCRVTGAGVEGSRAGVGGAQPCLPERGEGLAT